MLKLNSLFNNYFIRINEYPGYADLIMIESNLKRFPLFLALKHEGSTKENPHFHLLVSTTQVLATLRTYLKERFTLGKGNGHMSITTWDGEERAIQYLFHEEEAAVLCRKGFTEEFLSEQKEKARLFSSEKKKYTDNLHDKVMWEIFQNDTNLGDLVHEHKWDHRRLAMLIWDVCREQKKSYPNKFLLENMIRKVQAELSFKKIKNLPTWEDTKNDWYDQMFSRN